MKRWYLPSVPGSSDKRVKREPGADAPRVPSVGQQHPRVLFSSPECRIVVLDLRRGEEMGDHHVRERAVMEVISGRLSIEAGAETLECEAGTLVTFDPGERHALRGLDDARLLLTLRTLASGRTQYCLRDSPRSASACERHRRTDRLADLDLPLLERQSFWRTSVRSGVESPRVKRTRTEMSS